MSSLPRSPALASYAGERGGAVCCPTSLADLLGRGRTILPLGFPELRRGQLYPFNWFLSDPQSWGGVLGPGLLGSQETVLEEEWRFGALGKEREGLRRRGGVGLELAYGALHPR